MQVNRNDLLNTAFFIILVLSDLFSKIMPSFMGYADELFCLFLLAKILLKKKIDIKRIQYIVALGLLGIFGNFMYGLVADVNVVIYDAFIFLKPYIFLLYSLDFGNKQNKTIKYYSDLSKVMICVLFMFSIISLVASIGMTTDKGTFRFLSSFDGTVACWTIVFLSIIWNEKNKFSFWYYGLACVIIMRTGSGLGGLCIVGALLIYIFGERKRRFKGYYLIFIVPVCLFIARGEIQSYLLDANAPRALLYIYALITASHYFPLGSGFGSYGSAMAASHYSPLYIKYGFNMRWGMSVDYHPFLMDSYYPQIIAQFGFIGTLLFIMMWRELVWKHISVLNNTAEKYASIFLSLSWLVAGIGFGTGSVWGCAVFFTLGFMFSNNCIKKL